MSFGGFHLPNYTLVPNEFFDSLLPRIKSRAELAVLLAVFRFTFGFHRRRARMSLSFIKRASGLSRSNVVIGVQLCKRRGTIRRSGSYIELNLRGARLDFVFRSSENGASPKSGLGASPKTGLRASPKSGHKKTKRGTKREERKLLTDAERSAFDEKVDELLKRRR